MISASTIGRALVGFGFLTLLSACATETESGGDRYARAFDACDQRAGICYQQCEDIALEEERRTCQASCSAKADQCFGNLHASMEKDSYYRVKRDLAFYGRFGAYYPSRGYSYGYHGHPLSYWPGRGFNSYHYNYHHGYSSYYPYYNGHPRRDHGPRGPRGHGRPRGGHHGNNGHDQGNNGQQGQPTRPREPNRPWYEDEREITPNRDPNGENRPRTPRRPSPNAESRPSTPPPSSQPSQPRPQRATPQRPRTESRPSRPKRTPKRNKAHVKDR